MKISTIIMLAKFFTPKPLHKYIDKFLTEEIVAYLIAGVAATVVSLAAFWLPDYLGVGVMVSNIISHAVGITFAYFTNKIFVFRARVWKPAVVFKEIRNFVGGRLGMLVMETLLLILLVDIIGLHSFGSKIFTMTLVVIGNYVISKKAVFTQTG